jgi:Zn-dependent protease with chaperone function
MDKKILAGLNTREYEHPFDKKALASLEATPGLPALLKTIKKYSFDKVQKITHTGSYLQVGENQYPKLHSIYWECCDVLDFRSVPPLYLMEMYNINAYATCFSSPLIVLGTGAAEALTDDELAFILGHELGHIKSQHLLYHDLADILSPLGAIIGDMTLGIGNLVSVGLQVALLYWQRMSEFTSDRAGLLACQNVQAAITAVAKMAGFIRSEPGELNVEEFMLQARRFIGFDYDALDKIAKYYSVMEKTHPWTVMRAHELDQWITSGQYEAVLNRKAQANSLPFKKCAMCGEPVNPEDRFCSKCGHRMDG